MFDAKVYSRRREALVRELAGRGVTGGLVLFPGNDESPMNYADNAYRFRQDSGFLYFFGLTEPGLAATLDLATGAARLYADEPSMDDVVWTGPRPGPGELASSCGAVALPSSGLAPAVAGARDVLFAPPYRASVSMRLGELLGVHPGSVAGRASLPLVRSVIALREIKEPAEVAEIEKAVDVSVEMHKAVMRAARPGATEAQLMAEAYRVAYAGGGMPSFPAIATTRGAVLHNHGYSGALEEGGLFLLDAGAETAEGYAGDLTTTFPVGTRFDDRQRAVYDIVFKAGQAGSAAMRPGVPFREAHLAAARTIASGLKELGLMKGDADGAVEAGAHALFFPHGVGHQMGLDVHDMESYGEVWVGYDGEPKSVQFGLKSLRMAKALKPGMVMTMEPGVYFIPGLATAWESEGRHADFIDYGEVRRWLDVGGVRNESDWLVTADGARRLGKPFDKSASSIEAYRKAAAL